MKFHPIEVLIDELKKGRPIVMVDDENRENEGDVILPAHNVTPENINFLVKHARGLVCLCLTRERCEKLNLPLMVPNNGNGAKFGTNFTLSIEAAKGVTTGISAQDRAKTILAAVSPDAQPGDIVQPGHIFPIIAQPGGVLERAGHTEASTDMMRLAGAEPASVICEIMNEDGTMAQGQDLTNFCNEHQLKMGTIEDLIAYRMKHEPTVECIHAMNVPTAHGVFELQVFVDHISKLHHYAFIKGTPHREQEALIRVHMHDPLLDLSVMTNLTTGKWGIEQSLQAINVFGEGALVLLSQPIQPAKSLEHLGILSHFSNNKEKKCLESQNSPDLRLIGVGSQVLSSLGFGKMRVLGSEKRYYGLSGFGLEVTGFQPWEPK